MSKLNEMIEQYNALVGTQNKLIKQIDALNSCYDNISEAGMNYENDKELYDSFELLIAPYENKLSKIKSDLHDLKCKINSESLAVNGWVAI